MAEKWTPRYAVGQILHAIVVDGYGYPKGISPVELEVTRETACYVFLKRLPGRSARLEEFRANKHENGIWLSGYGDPCFISNSLRESAESWRQKEIENVQRADKKLKEAMDKLAKAEQFFCSLPE